MYQIRCKVTSLSIMHQSFVTTVPMGPGIKGNLAMLKYHHRPSSAMDPQGFKFHAQNSWGHFTFTCRDLSVAFHRALTAVLGIYPGFAKRKVMSPLFPDPIGAVVINDWCINFRFQ